MSAVIHTDHCVQNDLPCGDEPMVAGAFWNQPPGVAVEQAAENLGEDAPWCAVAEHANALCEAE